MENIIEVKNLKKHYYLFNKDYKKILWLLSNKGHYSVKKVLNGIDFSVKKGEIIGIIGKNGAGKSTLMSLIAGITFPSSGEISVKGSIGSLINLSAGFSGKYTGRENIYYKSNIMGMDKKHVDGILQNIIEFVDIGEYFDLPLSSYSSGMKARLGFALAVFSEPDLLIIDEVFAVGDKDFKQKSRKKTKQMFKSGKSILFSSHSENLIKQFCSRVVYLRDGKIVFDGNVNQGIKMYNKDILKLISSK
jgi:teichoic acid transport system ATP-binding protein